MTPRLRAPWLVAALLLAVAAGLYSAEWVEVTRNDGYSAAALRYPYLAAKQFLERYDVEIESRDGLTLLDALPPTTDTLLIASSRRSLSARRVADLDAWVRGGGRLVLLASDFWDEDRQSSGDALLDQLGVRVMKLDEEDEAPTSSPATGPAALPSAMINRNSCGNDASLVRINLADEDQDITTSLGTWSYLDYDGELEASYAGNALGPQLLYVSVGDGAIVLLTSLELWKNRNIHCHDHAHLLRWLADDRPVLWWLFNTDMQALPWLLWQRWPIAVAIVFAWLALWAWRSGFRVQRVAAQPDTARRELMEHIDGVARFYWQQGDSGRLLAALRRGVLRGAEPGAALVADLAERSGHSEERIRWALSAAPGRDSGNFLKAVRTLYDLHKLN